MNILLSFLKMQHCFFVLQRDAEVDDAITGFAQPQILIAGDIFDIDLIYIVAEGRIICQLFPPEIDFRCSAWIAGELLRF